MSKGSNRKTVSAMRDAAQRSYQQQLATQIEANVASVQELANQGAPGVPEFPAMVWRLESLIEELTASGHINKDRFELRVQRGIGNMLTYIKRAVIRMRLGIQMPLDLQTLYVAAEGHELLDEEIGNEEQDAIDAALAAAEAEQANEDMSGVLDETPPPAGQPKLHIVGGE